MGNTFPDKQKEDKDIKEPKLSQEKMEIPPDTKEPEEKEEKEEKEEEKKSKEEKEQTIQKSDKPRSLKELMNSIGDTKAKPKQNIIKRIII